MKILARYVLFEVAVFFGISLSAFTGLLLTLRMLRLTSLIVNRGVAFSEIATVFVSIIPTFLELALPLATLLGVMLAFSRLCGDSEIVVMRASGISLFRFLRPIAAFAITVGIVSLVVSTVLRPWGFSSLSRALFNVARSKSTAGLTEGVFNKLGALTLYAERIDYQSGDLYHVLVDDRRPDRPRKVVFAKKGRIVADDQQQSLALLLGDGTAHEAVEGKYSRTEFSSNSINIDPAEMLKDEAKRGLVARELATVQLSDAIDTLRSAFAAAPEDTTTSVLGMDLTKGELRKKIRRAEIEFGQRFSLPFASFIMAFMGMSLGIVSPRTQRSWGAGVSAALGLGVFILYYSFFSIGLALADSGALPVIAALWVPNVMLSLICLLFQYKVGSEQWPSVPIGLQLYFTSAVQWFKRRLQGMRT